MDPVQFADGSSLIRAYRVCIHDKIVWSAIQNMHLTWNAYAFSVYMKCWLDKGFNELDKINKKSRYFFVIYNSGIWIWVLLQGMK